MPPDDNEVCSTPFVCPPVVDVPVEPVSRSAGGLILSVALHATQIATTRPDSSNHSDDLMISLGSVQVYVQRQSRSSQDTPSRPVRQTKPSNCPKEPAIFGPQRRIFEVVPTVLHSYRAASRLRSVENGASRGRRVNTSGPESTHVRHQSPLAREWDLQSTCSI